MTTHKIDLKKVSDIYVHTANQNEFVSVLEENEFLVERTEKLNSREENLEPANALKREDTTKTPARYWSLLRNGRFMRIIAVAFFAAGLPPWAPRPFHLRKSRLALVAQVLRGIRILQANETWNS